MEAKTLSTESSQNMAAANIHHPSEPNNIFSSTYLHSLSQTPHRLRKRMLATWTPDQELNKVRLRSGADMKRKLLWYDLVALGLGGMLGVGVFVTTGPVAREIASPSIFISYIIAGIAALLSSLCYTEFSIEIPVAGGAFSYLRVTFGEFVGYFAGANILMEYVLSNAAVASNVVGAGASLSCNCCNTYLYVIDYHQFIRSRRIIISMIPVYNKATSLDFVPWILQLLPWILQLFPWILQLLPWILYSEVVF